MNAQPELLPGGWWDRSGRLQRDVELGPLTGRDEEALVAATAEATPAAVTSVLVRCLRRLGDVSPVPEDVVRELLVADREWLLLRLRRTTFGDRVQGDLYCPWPDCGQRVSVDFSIDDVPVRAAADPRPVYEVTLPPPGGESGAGPCVQFRLPNGGDVEELAPLAGRNAAHASILLLTRCLRRIGEVTEPDADLVAALPAPVRAGIEGEMERVAPAVDHELETPCSECGRPFAAAFDVRRFLFGELRTDVALLYREVHCLAYHYHWSEAEIMGMPRDRRRTYLDVLAGEIDRLNSGW